MTSPVRTWLLSRRDDTVHAFDLEAAAEKSYLEADCNHSAPRDLVQQPSSGGISWCRICLVKAGQRIPEDQPRGDAL